jgi:hypothetical protein
MTSRRNVLLLACALAFAATACEPADPVSVPTAPSAADLTASSGPELVRCRMGSGASTTQLVSPLGGFVSLNGHAIVIPQGALLAPTLITVTEPASRYVEVSIRANGAEHFQFNSPVFVVISYARCRRTLQHPLEAWHIDEITKQPLERMTVSYDDEINRKVAFITPHLSGYAIAE